MKTRSQGFTVIELLLVIVILCVLGALVALTASGVQAKNRNGARQSQIDTIKGQLESYYAQTDTYPTFANLNDGAWRGRKLPKLKTSALQDPHWTKKTPGCSLNETVQLASQPLANCFSYQVTSADGSSCDNAKTPCSHYTLTATLEGGEKYVKASLN